MIRDLFTTDVCAIPYTKVELAVFFVACLVACYAFDRMASDRPEGEL